MVFVFLRPGTASGLIEVDFQGLEPIFVVDGVNEDVGARLLRSDFLNQTRIVQVC